MKLSKGFKVVAFIVLITLLVGVVGAFFIADIAKDKIEQELSKNFKVNIADVDINLLNTTAFIDSIQLSSKNRDKDSIHVQLKSVNINFSSLFNVLCSDDIKISEIRLEHPSVEIYKGKVDSTTENQPTPDLNKSFKIKNLTVKNGSIAIYTAADSLNTTAKNIEVLLEDLLVSKETITKKIPFLYTLKSVRLSEIYTDVNDIQELRVQSFHVEHSKIEVGGLALEPKYSKKEYVNHIPYQTDWMDLQIQSVVINDYSFDLLKEKPEVIIPEINIDGANFQLYRDKKVQREFSFKPLYSKMLRDLNVDLKVDSIDIANSTIVYEEKLPERDEAGKLTFDDLHIAIANIDNINQGKKTRINIDSKFLNEAPLHIDWMFDIHNEQDYFEIQGSLGMVSVKELNNFLKPNMRIELAGKVDDVLFNFYGTDSSAKGAFSITYNNLEVAVLNKNNKRKKNKVLSAMANIFVKKDKEKFKQEEIAVDRTKYKSFFNYFWLCIQDGLKKSVL